MLSKKIIVIIIAGLLAVIAAIIGLVSYQEHQASLTAVTIHYNQLPGAVVKLYKGSQKNLVKPEITGQAVYTLTSGHTYTLEDWPYVVVVSGDGIEPYRQIIYPHQTPQTVSFSVSIAKSQLQSQLNREKPYILSAIMNSHTNIADLYTISDVALFGDGTWATAHLTYTGTDRYARDPLVAVLHKKSTGWSLAAGPKITISQTEVPEAPQSVFWSIIPQAIEPS